MPRPRTVPGTGSVTVRRHVDGWIAEGLGRDAAGEPVRVRVTRPTRAEALAVAQERLDRRLGTAGGRDAQSVTLGSLLADVEARREADPETPAGTVETAGRAVRQATALVGALTVAEATTATLMERLDTLRATPEKARLVRSQISLALDLAVIRGIVGANTARALPPVSRERKPVRALTTEEEAELRGLVHAWCVGGPAHGPQRTDRLEAVVDLMLATGCRIGEMLGLRWQDVEVRWHADVPTVAVTVRGQVVTRTGRGTYWQPKPKSSAGRRAMVLPGWAVTRVLALEEARDPECQWMIPGRGGSLSIPGNVRRDLRDALRGTRLAWVTPHTLRRTVGTWIADREGLEAARDQLGHSSVAITERAYAARSGRGPAIAAQRPHPGIGTRALEEELLAQRRAHWEAAHPGEPWEGDF